MTKNLYLALAVIAALAMFAIVTTMYGNAKYNAGKLYAEKVCEVTRHNEQQEAEYQRYKDDIGVQRLSMDDVVRVLFDRGELRD